MPTALQRAMQTLLTTSERRALQRLSTPQKVQDFLDALPVNFERRGETNRSPRRVLRDRTAHCFEGAMFAAAAFAWHGRPAWLLDFRAPRDEDHVVAPFRIDGLWGAVSKTNHAVLRYRDPIYRSVRELAMSYVHEFFEWDGRKSLREYSRPFDLARLAPEEWIATEDDLHWLVNVLDDSPHLPVAPRKAIRQLRPVAALELRTMRITEWNKRGKLNK
ncbi:MAG: hypothetical protein ACREPT_13100 [Rudaea sp.]